MYVANDFFSTGPAHQNFKNEKKKWLVSKKIIKTYPTHNALIIHNTYLEIWNKTAEIDPNLTWWVPISPNEIVKFHSFRGYQPNQLFIRSPFNRALK
jgi:hypothetical protein